MAESAEVCWSQGQSPRRVQCAAGGDATDQLSVGVEHVDQAEPTAGHFVVLVGVLLGVGHVQVALQVLYAERCIARRQFRVDKGACPSDGMERIVEDVDPGGVKISRVQKTD